MSTQNSNNKPVRDSFRFFLSYYEAISCLPDEQQLEIYQALASYALYGNTPELSDVARAVFTLIKPVLDAANTQADNGRRGGRPKKQSNPVAPVYNASFSEEAERMIIDENWCVAVCKDYNIDRAALRTKVKSFVRVCNETRADRPHNSLDDAKSHFRYWMDKTASRRSSQPVSPAPVPEVQPPAPEDYAFNGGFGGMDV